MSSLWSGSSPHVRGRSFLGDMYFQRIGFIPACTGTLGGPAQQREPARFIPACTGTLRTAWWKLKCLRVHPRVYGDAQLGSRPDTGRQGSSPRVRGRSSRPPVRKPIAASGSSPRVRGRLVEDVVALARLGFIPACTGTLSPRWAPAMSLWVHPRVYGDAQLAMPSKGVPLGSSPRVRGRSDKLGKLTGEMGSSPRVRGRLGMEAANHARPRGSSPRVRGRSARLTPSTTAPPLGSSPRVRGTLLLEGCRRGQYWVHPRVYGDALIMALSIVNYMGSSPRVRGR